MRREPRDTERTQSRVRAARRGAFEHRHSVARSGAGGAPATPRAGFHLGGALCGARITLSDDKGVIQTNSILGGGAVFDIGYEWALGDDWGIGVMGRLIGAGLTDGQTHHDVGGGSVLASLTFN